MPSWRHAWMTRSAISPRLAIRILRNIPAAAVSVETEAEERLAVLHRLGVLRVDLGDHAVGVALDLVHELHRLDDAQDLPLPDPVPDAHVRRRIGGGRRVERADDRRRQDV